jgi:hypothetical protein
MLKNTSDLYVKEVLQSNEEISPTSQHVIRFPWMVFLVILVCTIFIYYVRTFLRGILLSTAQA